MNCSEENPNFAQLESKKNSLLDDRLKQVYVTSTDHVVVSCIVRLLLSNRKINCYCSANYCQHNTSDGQTKKPLPLDRKAVEDFEMGYFEPQHVMRGRTSLRQALKFIGNHNAAPLTWTSEKIADEYKLKPSVVGGYIVQLCLHCDFHVKFSSLRQQPAY